MATFYVNDSTNMTGLIFDNRMANHNCLFDEDHIERPERYIQSLQKCRDYGLIDRCFLLPSRLATEEELLLVHSEEYVKDIKRSELLKNVDEFETFSSKFDSIYFNLSTYHCALISSGCTIELVSSVLNKTVRNGLAIVRPPGHHAMAQAACGFCVFNNVAIAAKYAIKHFNLKRILIIDWDVHHGQATQQAFYDDPRVLYFSIHRYENGNFWPHLRESNFDYIGGAKGFNFNVPLNGVGLENADYLAIFNNVLLPVAYEYCPELVLISAGYDAALGCPEGEMRITPAAYSHFLNSISSLADGKVCVILEGGYNLDSLSESVALTLRGLLGDPCPMISSCSELKETSKNAILNIISVQRPFWHSLQLQKCYNQDEESGTIKHVLKFQYAGNPLEGLTTFETKCVCPVQSSTAKLAFEEEIKDLILKTDLSVSTFKTGFVFDIEKLSEKNFSEFDMHISKIYQKLLSSGILSECIYLQPENENMYELVEKTSFAHRLDKKLQGSNQSFFYNTLLKLVDAVADKDCTNGLAIINPTLDNDSPKESFAEVCTKYLTVEKAVGRILIINFAKQNMHKVCNSSEKIICISLSQNDVMSKGNNENSGTRTNFDIDFNHNAGDGDYLAAFFHIVLPVAYEFCPEFCLVALGSCDFVTPSCFAILCKLLSGLCNGKIVLVSELNSGSEATAQTLVQCLSVLLNKGMPSLTPLKPSCDGIEAVRNVREMQKRNWNTLAFDVEVPENFGSFD